jgi:hypothetical protein
MRFSFRLNSIVMNQKVGRTSYHWSDTGCPTTYKTRQLFNNFTTNEDIATKFEADLPHCVRNVTTS